MMDGSSVELLCTSQGENMEKAIRLAIIFVALLAGALMVTAPAAAAASADVAGEWNLAVETPNSPRTPTGVFKQAGETPSQNYKGPYGESTLKLPSHHTAQNLCTHINDPPHHIYNDTP